MASPRLRSLDLAPPGSDSIVPLCSPASAAAVHGPGTGGARLDRLVAWRHFDAFLVVTLAALALVLHGRTLWTSYWGDEAIAVGIAAHPLSSLPHYLVEDGSPPLYYVALHYWMRLFGQSEVATHVLSLVPALLAIPAAWWSAGRLFGRWAARAAAGLVATCAYLAYYSTETRMYSWLVLVALLAVTCFVLAYRGAGRRYWVATTLLMAAVLYLQYYGLYLLAATVIVGSAVAVRRRALVAAAGDWLYGGTPAPCSSPPGCPSSSTSSATRAPRGLPTPPCSTSSGTRSTPWPRPPGPPSSSPWSSPCFP